MKPAVRVLAISCLAVIWSGPAFAAEGTTVYAAPNCYVFETTAGFTLFERSGGGEATLGQAVSGVLDDFGYQELKDAAGRDLMVGWIQNHSVKDEAEVEDFKKVCR